MLHSAALSFLVQLWPSATAVRLEYLVVGEVSFHVYTLDDPIT